MHISLFTRNGDRNARHARLAAALLVLLFFLSVAISYLVYRRLVQNEERQFEATLDRVADIRTAAVSAWAQERLGDAMVFGGGRFLGEAINSWMARGSPHNGFRRQLREQLATIKITYGYIEVAILDRNGGLLVSTEDRPPPLDAASQQAMLRALAGTQTEISSIRALPAAGPGQIVDFFSPILPARENVEAPASVLFLRANADLPLEPFVHAMPLFDTSTEVFLVEIRDSRILIASSNGEPGQLHFQSPLPITVQQLNASARTPAAHFMLHDNQGDAWISAARKIHGTPWFLITALNHGQIRGNLRILAWTVGSITAAFACLLALAALSWLRKQQSDMRLEALQAAAERQRLQRQYDYLSRYANDMIILADAKGHILEANDKTSQLLGLTHDALLRMCIEDLFPPSCHALLESTLAKLRDEGTAVFELLQQHANGSTLPVEVSARTLTLSGKTLVQMISRDISERKQAQAALQESRDKLNSILASIHDVVWSFSPGLGRLNYMNRSVEEIYGYAPSDFERNPHLWLDVIHPQDRPQIDQALRGFDPAHPSCDMEFRIVRNDGALRWVHCRSQMVFAMTGQPLRIDGVSTDITLRKAAEQQVQALAYYDNVTSLPNRTLFNDRLAQATHMALRSSKKVAVLFMDLDNFKHVNDSLGHQAGDLLLRSIGERLLQCVREEDTVARLGGDEFVVVLPDIERGEQAAAVAEKILHLTAQPFMLQEQQVHATISIGISVFPEDGRALPDLLKHADAALYQAKSQGRNNFQFFTPELNRQLTRSLYVERQLRHAIDAHDLRLLYQPQVDIMSGKVIGAEALLRWRQQDKEVLSPAEFIPVAEERGLIGTLGEWALREACLQSRRWQQEGLRPIPLSVNVSPLQFQQKGFATFITRLLQDTHTDPACLGLEITESAIMRRAPQVAELARNLRSVGVKINIDDFGTGYSSLSYLKQIPIDKIKIDRSFIAHMLDNPDDEAITCAIINLARSLKLGVIAEGVESREQLERLRQFGCHEVQGYYYSSAVPADILGEFLASDKIFAEPVA
ncbi:bifunctional diguanylate cyclase/phosphodiesterase [Noviherbaspirillum autotrophicum]|uniref:bifunctional diguanylate cyclase/phosphodiesterase n=1 Tax=Noviherbaspirillum autotrophicum TaxID=709839 RepID=UPI0009FD4472|nr:EAL domain-containing protein [Noviherbaspirillum autotrophicum]